MSGYEPGQEVFFRTVVMGEDGRQIYRLNSGVIREITENGFSLNGTGETEGMFQVKSYEMSRSREELEWHIKWDQSMSDFEHRLDQTAEKYIGGLMDLAKNMTKGSLKAQMPSELSPAMQTVGLKMKIMAGQFKDRVSELTDHFLADTKKNTLERMDERMKNFLFHTDLSSYEPGQRASESLILEDRDLTGIPLDRLSDIRLDAGDLPPVAANDFQL